MLGVRAGLSSSQWTRASVCTKTAPLQYRPLDPNRREIRLLDIVPARWSADMRCDLKTVSLDEEPAYTALSYVWGNPNDTVPITVQDCSFQATKNLVAAMRRLRSSKEPLTIWIDAICIDQKNLDEKTQQVTMMGSIYGNASEVAIFLGESGILDIVPAEDMEAWLDAPKQEWHHDESHLMMQNGPPLKAFVERSQTMANFFEFLEAATDPDAERADPKEYPAWVVFDPEEGIKDQARIDTFYERQTNAEYGRGVDDTCRLFRESQEGAFAILNQLSNGRCLKSCVKGGSDSVAWTNALRVIEHISELPWWSRAWVMQESILPIGKVFAIYGENRVDSIQLFENAGSAIPRHHERGECCKVLWNSMPRWQQDALERFSRLMEAFNHIRSLDAVIAAHPLERLYDAVSRARHLGATDPRDKIYGLLGVALNATYLPSTTADTQEDMSTDHQQSNPGSTEPTVSDSVMEAAGPDLADYTAVAKIDKRPGMLGIVPDYKRTAIEVYTKFALRLILHQRSFGVLAVKEDVPVGLEDLPSWVPKWSPSVDGLSAYISRERLNHFKACHSNTTIVPELVDDFALAVVGRRFDRIAATMRPFYQAVTPVLDAVKEIEEFFGLALDPNMMYQNSITLASAAWRTMFGDLLYYLDKEGKTHNIKFQRIQRLHIQLLSFARRIWDGDDANVYIGDGEVPISLQDEPMLDFAETARKSFWYANEARLFFKTEHGYIGSAPADALVGDEIAIIEGSLFPFLLRRIEPVARLPTVKEGKLSGMYAFDDSWFKFIGCPYVCGVMDGEAGFKQTAESIKALMDRAGDVHSRKLHLATAKTVAAVSPVGHYMFLA